jgi:outer membrane receptor protein involved in Fe transport
MAAKGYRIGGVNPPAPASRCAADLAALGVTDTPETYRSDHVWSYEAGVKSTLFDRRLSLQSSAYWIDWDRIQQSVSLPRCGFQFTANLGSAVSRGFDLALQARPTADLSLSFSLAYVDARFEDTVTGGVVDPRTGRHAVIVADGDRLGARPWTLAASAEYRFFVGVPAYVRADYEYLGPQASRAPVNDPLSVAYDLGLPAVGQAQGLAVRAGGRFGKVELSLFADNLLDTAPRLLRAHDSRTSPLYAAVTQTPRTVGVTANYAF